MGAASVVPVFSFVMPPSIRHFCPVAAAVRHGRYVGAFMEKGPALLYTSTAEAHKAGSQERLFDQTRLRSAPVRSFSPWRLGRWISLNFSFGGR